MHFEAFQNIFSKVSLLHLNILFLLGLALFGGTMGGRLFQRLKIPQVVGYIIIGIIVGQSGLNVVNKGILSVLEPFNYFALGLIGFMIGGELKKDVISRYGRQFIVILLSEGLGAFFLVSISLGFLGMFIMGNAVNAWALALLMGAIASATAPAATTDVLWEYKSRGPLTTMVLGIVAMDDALALFLFALASSIAAKIIGAEGGNFWLTFLHPAYAICASVFVGAVSGLFLVKILKQQSYRDKILALSLGTVLLVLGLSLTLKIDMLLAAMALGAVVVNFAPHISKEVFKLVSGFTPPIYVLFFVLVGAKLNMGNLNPSILVLATVYLFGRSFGKMLGANFGARLSKASKSVQKYLPFCLFSQAGVAIGLSIIAYQLFPGDLGNAIVVIITTTTFIVQIIGPPSTKYAIIKAGEAGLNITEEDIIRRAKISDIMDKNPPLIRQDMRLSDVLNIFKDSTYLYYPVVNRENKLEGIVTVDSIRQTFSDVEFGNLLLAHDLMEPAAATVSSDTSMLDARDLLERYHCEYLPVVDSQQCVAGFVERRMFNKFISTQMMELKRRVQSLE